MAPYVQFWLVFYGNKNPIVYAFPKLPYSPNSAMYEALMYLMVPVITLFFHTLHV